MTAASFIIRLPAVAGTWMPVKVQECDVGHAVHWDRDIQTPWIKGTGRVDADWNWPMIYLRSSMLEVALRRELVYMQIVTPTADGLAWPVGQVMMVNGYPFPPNRRQRCVFVWYLAGTPAEALEAVGARPCKGLMSALLDCAIQFSVHAGHKGRICLHASPDGTEAQQRDLFNRYAAQGLKLVQDGRISAARRNDGRYFYADAALAKQMTTALDAWR